MSAQQILLFSEPGVRHDNPDTSRDAADTVKPSHQGTVVAYRRMGGRCRLPGHDSRRDTRAGRARVRQGDAFDVAFRCVRRM